ncbi:uncharacterized protein TNCV_5032721 [Trichonephila clavipes]|nr:uncharacterized protein TNCV_5032721 [Trichonephila clavipes]
MIEKGGASIESLRSTALSGFLARPKAFLRRRGINIQLFVLRREHEDFKRKTSDLLDEKLEKAIYSKTKVLYCSTKKNNSFNKIMKQDIQLFDSPENPSSNIIKLCEVLKTIPPTSVETERAFSAAGLFVTKLRTRLSENFSENLF